MKELRGLRKRKKQVTAVVLIIAMMFSQMVSVAADPLDGESSENILIETPASDNTAAVSQDEAAGEENPAVSEEASGNDTPAPGEEAPGNAVSEDSVSGNTVSDDSVSDNTVSGDSASDNTVSEDTAEPELEENTGGVMYTVDAVSVNEKNDRRYPGVYSARILSSDRITENMTIGIPSVANSTLADNPTTESPAIIMGGAVPYERRVGPMEFDRVENGALYAPYSSFRYEIIEEANLNGEGGTHKKMSGYDGTYMILRVDVRDLINGAENRSYLHFRQTNNKAIMVNIGQTVSSDHATFSDAMGDMTGSYLISDNKLVMRDRDGGYTDVSYIDVVFLSSGTLVQGADTGGKPADAKAPLADFPISFYVDQTGDYDPEIEWNSSLGTAVKKSDGKEITLTPEETQAGITPSDKVLAKYFDEKKAEEASARISKYIVKGSDVDLDIEVSRNTASGKNEYWSLKKAMGYPSYGGKPLKLICEVPLLDRLEVREGGNEDVILDVFSFDVQLANNTKTDAAAITVDGNVSLTIRDTFNTTGAELAVGNNASLLVTNGGTLVIEDTSQLEVEYDSSSLSAGDVPKGDLKNGVMTVNNGGKIINRGVITVEGKEGKPQNAGEVIIRDYANAVITIGEGGTLDNYGCVLMNGELYNLGTIINRGRYTDVISSNDPDRGNFTYHKGIQLSWKDDITQGNTNSGELHNGVDENGNKNPSARFENEGDLVMVPGYLENYGTVDNKTGGNIYMCAVDEIVIPISPHADRPLMTEQRINLGYDETSFILNDTGSKLFNSGKISTVEIPVVSNGRTGDISANESRYINDINIRSEGTVDNTGIISVNALITRNKVTNSGNGVIRRVIVGSWEGNTGSVVDSSTNRSSRIYNAAKTVDNGTDIWEFVPMSGFSFADGTEIHNNLTPGTSVNWVVRANSSRSGEGIVYPVTTYMLNPFGIVAKYEVSANEEIKVTSPVIDDVNYNLGFVFFAEDAAVEDGENIGRAVVRVNGTGFIHPTAMQGLSYNGKDQPLVTAGSMPGGKVLYKVGSGDYSDNIPTAKNAGTYTVEYKAVNGSGADVAGKAGTISVTIGKRAAFIAADDIISKNAAANLSYVTGGIVDADKAEFGITVGKEGAVLTPAYNTAYDSNYNVNIYKGKYTVIAGDEAPTGTVQAVLRSYDPVAGGTVSINASYAPTQKTRSLTMYYSLSQDLLPENYTAYGTSTAPTFGGMGEQIMHYYVTTPDGDFSGEKPVVITRADQASPKDLKVETFLIGNGGTVSGIQPYNSEKLTAEYRRADEETYTRAVFSAVAVPAGNYYFRYCGDNCNNPSPDLQVSVVETKTHTVRFDSMGGTAVPDCTGLKYLDQVTVPAKNPTKGGTSYEFTGWYTGPDCTSKYDFNTLITGYEDPSVIYAGWCLEIPEASDEDVEEIIKDIGGEDNLDRSQEGTADGGTKDTITVSGEPVSVIITDPDGKVTISSQLWVGGLSSDYVYTGSAIKPEIRVYDGMKRLTEKTDYTVGYKYNKDAAEMNAEKAPVIIVRFTGCYKGNETQNINFRISPAVFGKEIDVHGTGVVAKNRNKEQKPLPVVVWNTTGKAVNKKFFTVTYDRPVTEAGKYTAWVEAANANYKGKVSANITVGDKDHVLEKGKVKLTPSKYTYTGKPIIPDTKSITFKLGGKTLTYGTDYEISDIYDNVEPGKAAIVFKAVEGNKNGYTGTKTAEFTITRGRALSDAKDSGFTFNYAASVDYVKGGAKPAVIVKDGNAYLKSGVDYTVTYSKNKNVTGGKKSAVATVKGKGNYKGSVKLAFDIGVQDVAKLDVIAADQFGARVKKPRVTVTDLDQKKLGSGDFTVGDPVQDKEVKDLYSVTVKGSGKNYTGSHTVQFRLLDSSRNISKAKLMEKIPDQEYTGSIVTLNRDDLKQKLYVGQKKEPVYLSYNRVPQKDDFKILNYRDNVKKGNAKVTVQGLNGYAGSKTVNFKITVKKAPFRGVMSGGRWR